MTNYEIITHLRMLNYNLAELKIPDNTKKKYREALENVIDRMSDKEKILEMMIEKPKSICDSCSMVFCLKRGTGSTGCQNYRI